MMLKRLLRGFIAIWNYCTYTEKKATGGRFPAVSKESILEEFTLLDGSMSLYRYTDDEVERFKMRAMSALNYILYHDLVLSLDGDGGVFMITQDSYDRLCQHMMEMRYAEEVQKTWPPESNEKYEDDPF